MNDEQAAHLRKAEEALQAAQMLFKAGLADNACSRAYYVMFHAAKAALIQKNIHRSRHAGVIAAFGEHYAKTGSIDPVFHRWIVEAEKDRVVAEYSTKGTAADLAREHIAHAEVFLSEIRKILAET